MTRECEIECVPYQGNSLLFVYYVTYVTGGAAFVFLWGKVGVALFMETCNYRSTGRGRLVSVCERWKRLQLHIHTAHSTVPQHTGQ